MSNARERHPELRAALRELCKRFPDEYFRGIDEARGYPEAFVDALTQAGWLAVMIPEEYGGAGLGLAEASVGRAWSGGQCRLLHYDADEGGGPAALLAAAAVAGGVIHLRADDVLARRGECGGRRCFADGEWKESITLDRGEGSVRCKAQTVVGNCE